MGYSQEDMDAILKKLAENGYGGLSQKEKQVLFYKQLKHAHHSHFETKTELFLSILVTSELILIGLQRIVLAAELPLFLKLGSVSRHNSSSTWLNLLAGIFLVLFFGVVLTLMLYDYWKKKIYFFGHRPGRKRLVKYLGKIIFLLLVVLWFGSAILSAWPAFIYKIF